MKQVFGFLSFLQGILLFSCSAPVISMKCQEIRMRLENAETTDQKRFGAKELEDCEKSRVEAIASDSSVMEGIQKKFSSAEDGL